MSIKLPISAIALATVVTLAHSAIAAAEVYKTSTNQVVMTGLNSKQKYDIQTVNAKSKTGTRHVTTNACGEAVISNATKYKSLVVNNQTIDPNSIETKTHARCKAKKTTTAKATKKTTTTTTLTPVTTTTTTISPTTTPTVK